MVKDLDIKDVYFIGQVKNDDVYDYLDKADIFLSSPIVDNQPMSILEAYNSGLLVISSNVGGVPYMVEDGKTGLLFESDNHQELSEKMLGAVINTQAVIAIIQAGHKTLSYYSWENIKYKILNIYAS